MNDPTLARLEAQARDIQHQIALRKHALAEAKLPTGPMLQVIGLVASEWGVEPADLVGDNRAREFTTPRMVAMAVGHRALGYSHGRVAQAMQRHASVVSTCIATIESRCHTDTALAARMDRIAATIRAFPKQRSDA